MPRRGCLLPFAQALVAGCSLLYFCSPLSMLLGGPASKSPRPTVGPKPDLLCDFAPLWALVSSSVICTFLPPPPTPPPALFAAIQNSLVGGPILQNVLGTVTSENQGLLGSGGLLGGGGLLGYGGVFGVVEELSG